MPWLDYDKSLRVPSTASFGLTFISILQVHISENLRNSFGSQQSCVIVHFFLLMGVCDALCPCPICRSPNDAGLSVPSNKTYSSRISLELDRSQRQRDWVCVGYKKACERVRFFASSRASISLVEQFKMILYSRLTLFFAMSVSSSLAAIVQRTMNIVNADLSPDGFQRS